MKVALCQMAIEFEKKEVNTRRAIRFMEQARSEGADFVLFPEMSLTGFSMNIGLTGERNRCGDGEVTRPPPDGIGG